MKSKKLSVVMAFGALFAVASTNVFASDKWLGDRGDNWEEHIKSTKSRAEVVAEMEQARAQGLLRQGDDPHYPATPVVTSSRSREAVRAEAAKANAAKKPNPDYSSGQ